MRQHSGRSVLLSVLLIVGSAAGAGAVSSPCEDCHAKVTPWLVKDFNRGVMAETMGCADCHGEGHTGMDDADQAKLPTIATCQECHEDQAGQYLAGKHAKGLLAVEALPFSHGQPDVFVEGQKGCGGCHTLGIATQENRMTLVPGDEERTEEPAVTLQRMADRVASMILTSSYSDLECALAERELRMECLRLCPDRMELFDRIYTARFRRLRDQFRD